MLGVFFQDAEIPGAQDNKFCTATLVLMDSQYGSCFMYPSGGRNFEVASTFLKTLCAHILCNKNKFMC